MSILRACAFCAAAVLACGSVDGYGPNDGQPTQQVVHVEANGGFSLTAQHSKSVYETVDYVYTVMVPGQETVTLEVNGETRQESRTVMKPETRVAKKMVCKHVCEMACSPLDPLTAKAFEVDGRRIPVGALTKRLTDKSLVVVSATDEMIPEYYASVFKPGTIILALPRPSMMQMPVPAPAPSTPAPAPPPPVGAAIVPALKVRQAAFQPPAIATPVGPPVGAPFDSGLPPSPAPTIVFVTRSGADDLKIRQFVETPSEGELTIRANDSTVAPEVMMKVPRLTRHSETTVVPLEVLRFSSSNARDIAADRIKERLGAGETTVLISADGQPVDEFWLQNIQPRVPVLRGVKLPPVSGGMGYGGGMAAPPMAYPAPSPVPTAPPPPGVAPAAAPQPPST